MADEGQAGACAGRARPGRRRRLDQARRPAARRGGRAGAGESYISLGLYAQADSHIVAMLTLYRQIAGEDDDVTLTAKTQLGKLRRLQGRFDESLSLHRDVLERRRRLFGPDDRKTIGDMNQIAVVLEDLGKLKEAEPLYREAPGWVYAHSRRRCRGNATGYRKPWRCAQRDGSLRPGRATAARKSYEGRKRTLGDDDPDTLIAESDLADLLRHNGNLVEAESLLRHALQHTRKVVGDEHPRTSSAEEALAVVLKLAGRYEESTALYRGFARAPAKVAGRR